MKAGTVLAIVVVIVIVWYVFPTYPSYNNNSNRWCSFTNNRGRYWYECASASINQSVDAIYVIAVPQRKAHMQQVARHYGMTVQFIDPVMKDTLEIDQCIRDTTSTGGGRERGRIHRGQEEGPQTGIVRVAATALGGAQKSHLERALMA